MPFSPQQLRSFRFDEGLRGYDKRQVDNVMHRVADLVEELQGRLSEGDRRASGGGEPGPSGDGGELDETLRRTLILAQRTADAAVKEAREEAARIRAEAEAEVEALRARAEAEVEALRARAEAEVEEQGAEAAAERARLLAEARQECEDRIARVEAELVEAHQSLRSELLDQVTELTQIRDLLADDIERLEEHIATRRAQVRAALDEVAAVLDDPDKLHGQATSPLEVVATPEPEGFEPVSLELGAMDGFPESEPSGPVPADPVATGGHALDDDLDGGGDGPPTEAHVLALDGTGAPGGFDEPARPAWADAVPPAAGGGPEDPFGPGAPGLDEESEAMQRFFNESEEERRSGWFRRKG